MAQCDSGELWQLAMGHFGSREDTVGNGVGRHWGRTTLEELDNGAVKSETVGTD